MILVTELVDRWFLKFDVQFSVLIPCEQRTMVSSILHDALMRTWLSLAGPSTRRGASRWNVLIVQIDDVMSELMNKDGGFVHGLRADLQTSIKWFIGIALASTLK